MTLVPVEIHEDCPDKDPRYTTGDGVRKVEFGRVVTHKQPCIWCEFLTFKDQIRRDVDSLDERTWDLVPFS